MKTFYILLFLLIILIGAGFYLQNTYKKTDTKKNNVVENKIPETKTPQNNTQTPANTPPKTNPTPTLKCGNGGSCSALDVAPHNTRNNCWVYLSPINKVYNITEYVSNGDKHPGGDVIVPYCGKNIYDFFIGSLGGHAHSNRAEKLLEKYYVGPLK